MISALLLGSALALGPATSRLVPVSEPTLIDRSTHQELSFLAHVTETGFKALNPAAHPVLLVFGHRDGGVHASVLLAPGDQLESRFPRGTLDDLWIEVVSFEVSGRTSTGALELNALRSQGAQVLWVERQAAWILDDAGRYPLKSSSAHVPGAVPRGNKHSEKAPRIKRDPLPPL